MSLDTSLSSSLNLWGENHVSLVRALASDSVYAVIIFSSLWFLFEILKAYPPATDLKDTATNFLLKGVLIFGIPIVVATVVSKSISAIHVRQRPFVSDPSINLLVPHAADGGMPSHHMAFMFALVTTLFLYGRGFAIFLGVLTLLSGIGRVAAGIHYPSDIIAGAALGIAIAYLCHLILKKILGTSKILAWPNRPSWRQPV